ncbi:hypothetical protein [Dyadobacter sediminis]|uniref:Uncharacterized protein n=1 Tax=Dyadobacter sediminis TaxID=1493691 RepID=A0A5R9KDJ7_9BACT|nr:hypothetical protein [Dyadobacter sediminis]TLU94204.1 hypothetical protein FEM55_08075 [Dyadobacter sediminis]GGB93307.1 hypothetical protein GCM10011325_20920 [Dyadobacter sediminis]
MIRISTLPLIESIDQFYHARQILLVDVLFVGDTPRNMREYIKNNHGGFIYDKKTYIPITLTGDPESLIANIGKPIIFKFDKGFENNYHFNGNLKEAIWYKKLYDMSAYAHDTSIAFEREEAFIIERYLSGAKEFTEPEIETSLLALPAKPASIGLKAMKGLKPVRK